MKISEMLRKGAELLNEHTWMRGEYFDVVHPPGVRPSNFSNEPTAFCAIGACCLVSDRTVPDVEHAIAELLDETDLAGFNDSVSTTLEAIKARMEELAKQAEVAGQ